MAWRAAFGQVLGKVLGSDGDELGAPPEVRRAQELLASGESSAAAWDAVDRLFATHTGSTASALDVETWATIGVAAAAAGRLEDALECFRRGKQIRTCPGSQDAALESLSARGEVLLKQRQGDPESLRKVCCGGEMLPELRVPSEWVPWAGAMPKAVEFVGPVEVRWVGDAKFGQRGLFASRDILAGEPLLLACPYARAGSADELVPLLQRVCHRSKRASMRVSCLADGSTNAVAAPHVVMHVLGAAVNGALEPDVHSLDFAAIVARNAVSVPGGASLYGLPSIVNHSCDGHDANALLESLPCASAVVFKAARDISSDEEIRRRYFDAEGPVRIRRGLSASFAFECQCRRCVFESSVLPGSRAGAAVECALAAWDGRLRAGMRELWSSSDAATCTQDIVEKREALLRDLMATVRSVEDAAIAQTDWGDDEVAWCLALLQPISNASLYCLLPQTNFKYSDAVDVLSCRCTVLRRIEAAWRRVGILSFDHVQNLYMLWQALDEARMRAVASAAEDMLPAGVGGDSAGEEPSWPTMKGSEFFKAVAEHGFHSVLEKAGGLLQVLDALPEEEAAKALETLQGLQEDEWTLSANLEAKDADHRFWRYEGKKVDGLKHRLQQLAPHLHPIFHGARYTAGGKITLHNDALRWVVQPHQVVYGDRYPEGSAVFRKIALIYYLTHDWSRSYGGCLVDNMEDGPKVIVPKFNSFVTFLVPREHWVTEMASHAPARYTVFGWFSDLEPYRAESLMPLGTGNKAFASNAGTADQPSPPALGAAVAANGTTEPHATSSSATARAAAREALEVQRRCERAFAVHFGIGADELAMGRTGSRVGALLRKLRERPK